MSKTETKVENDVNPDVRKSKPVFRRMLLLFLIITSIGLTSCGDEAFFSETREIRGTWKAADGQEFTFPVEDTIAGYNIYFDLRTTTDYRWQNIFIFMDMERDGVLVLRDTFEIDLADKTGKWTGEPTGTLVDNHIRILDEFVFPSPGEYTIRIEQAMREMELSEISDVGLSIYPAD